jgi:hypothetical protein
MSKTDALLQLEKFFYQGLEHNGVQFPAAINFTHYSHGTGQVRSNTFVDRPWQLREFKKLLRSCALELSVVALELLRMFVSVLASENFLSKSSLSTPVAPRLKTKALINDENGYCELQVKLDKDTNKLEITL